MMRTLVVVAMLGLIGASPGPCVSRPPLDPNPVIHHLGLWSGGEVTAFGQ